MADIGRLSADIGSVGSQMTDVLPLPPGQTSSLATKMRPGKFPPTKGRLGSVHMNAFSVHEQNIIVVDGKSEDLVID